MNTRRVVNWRLLLLSIALLGTVTFLTWEWHRRQLHHLSAWLLRQARMCEAAEQFDQASDHLYRFLQIVARDDPRRPGALLRLTGDFDRANTRLSDKSLVVQWYYRAIGQAPGDVGLQARLAELFLETNQLELALEQADKVLSLKPGHPVARKVQVIAQVRRLRQGYPENLSTLAEELAQLHRQAPGDIELAELLADLYRRELSLVAAERADGVMQRLVEANDQNPQAWLARARYRVRFQLPDARHDIDQALSLAPDQPQVVLAAAEEALDSGDWQRGVTFYRQLLEQTPRHPAVYLGLGLCYRHLGQMQQAIATWHEGLKIAPAAEAMLVYLATTLLESEQYDQAEEVLDRLAQVMATPAINPATDRIWAEASCQWLQARLLLSRGHISEAIPPLRRAAQRIAQPADARQQQLATVVHRLLAETYQGLQQWGPAARHLETLVQLHPQHTGLRLQAARLWQAAGWSERARVLCEQALADQPHPEAWFLLAQLSLQHELQRPPAQREWQAAERALQQAAAGTFPAWQCQLLRWQLQTAQGRPVDRNQWQTLADRQLAKLEGSQRKQFLEEFAAFCLAIGEVATAEQWYQQLAEEFPETEYRLVLHWARHGQPTRAAQWCCRQLDQQVTLPILRLLARVLLLDAHDELTDACYENYLQQALQAYPHDHDLLFALGNLRVKQGRLREATEFYRQLVHHHPYHSDGWNNLAAVLAEQPEHRPEALQAVEQALRCAAYPTPNLLDTKALILLQQGKPRAALPLLRQAASPERDPRYWLHLAWAYWQTDAPEQAKQTLVYLQDQPLHENYLTRFEQQALTQLKAELGWQPPEHQVPR